jgi:hypothetical protein
VHRFTIDRAKDRPDPRVLLHRSYYAHDVPRMMAVCRLLGHKPVIDGYDSKHSDDRARWVTCDRCGVRPEPQGRLDPDQWNLGQPYAGPYNGQHLPGQAAYQLAKRGIVPKPSAKPGPWPAHPTGALGAELIVGRALTTGIGIKVGNPGSEQVLSARLALGPIGALYMHTEHFGQWIQRRLNPDSYESREIDVSVHDGRIWWKVWARRNEHRASDPKWMNGNVAIDPRDYLLGPQKNRKVSETEEVPAVVRMPEGDSYDVLVHLEKWETRRTRGRARTFWRAEWERKEGIPVRNHSWKGDEYYSSSWAIEGVTPDNPRWPNIIAAAAAEHCSRDRARYNYRAPEAA